MTNEERDPAAGAPADATDEQETEPSAAPTASSDEPGGAVDGPPGDDARPAGGASAASDEEDDDEEDESSDGGDDEEDDDDEDDDDEAGTGGGGSAAAASVAGGAPGRPRSARSDGRAASAAPSVADLAVHVDDRFSAVFVVLVIGVFVALLLNALLLGQGGFIPGLAASPTPSPVVTPSP